ncbi:unnamed protein product, partial [Effrenium voratum]
QQVRSAWKHGAPPLVPGCAVQAMSASLNGDGAQSFRPRFRVRGLDCEMVGVGPKGKSSVLIRISVVSRRGKARAPVPAA